MAMTEQQNMMRRLQVQCFVLDDVKLFLDTHPDDRKALEYYHKYRKLAESPRFHQNNIPRALYSIFKA